MLRAAALTYGLLVTILIAMVCGALLLFNNLHEQQIGEHEIGDRLQRNAHSGINVLLSQEGLTAPTVRDLFGDGHDSVKLFSRPWGGYEFLVSEALHAGRKHQVVAMAGYQPKGGEDVALYLADRNRPLKLCGPAEVRGTCYLPAAGVERAYIEGQNYSGDKLIYGPQKSSEKQLPALNEDLLQHNLSYLQRQQHENDSLVNLTGREEALRHPFDEATAWWYSEESISLDGVNLGGNVIVQSERAIYVAANSTLEGILLYAPYIEIAENFVGECQLIAADSIFIGPYSELRYPSFVAVLGEENTVPRPCIQVQEGSLVEGPVLAWQEKSAIRFPPYISIAAGAAVHGQVYCKGMIELQGEVAGSVYCERFHLKTPSSVYENHLLGAIINAEARSNYYAGALLPGTSNQKTVVKWL